MSMGPQNMDELATAEACWSRDRLKAENERLRAALKNVLHASVMSTPLGLIGANGPATMGERLLWRIDRMKEFAEEALKNV